MMRRRGPGLVRVAATTAVVAGTANAVNRAMAPKPQQSAPPPQQYDQQYDQYQQQPEVVYVQSPQYESPAAAPLPSVGVTQDQINQLQQLAQLKDQGILTQQEFDAQKAKILNS